MNKTALITVLLSLFASYAKSQAKLDDFGRIVLNTYLSEKINLPGESKKLLETKLNQITSNNGMGGSAANPRFIITAVVNIGTKDIIPGPPQMIAQNFSLTLFVGDAIEDKVFSNTSISLKGVGTNENKAFIDALKNINPKNKEVAAFVEEAKNKIIAYYATKCDFLIKESQTLRNQGKFDESIYKLSLVPEVCQSCYFKCLDTLSTIYQQKINADCREKLTKAKSIWMAEQSPSGAEKTGDILSEINPMSNCQPEVAAFIKNIDAKLKADEKERWQFKMKQYADNVAKEKEQTRIAEQQAIRNDALQDKQAARNLELDKIRVSAYRDVAVKYAENQPKTVTYNNIYWR
ncbi:MAG: hypothetical protein IPP77_03810 [Bacteroidetes bacterium]|nr:hypothetical protein [Bacteroidota bacterium]